MDGNMAMILGIIAVVFVVVCVFLSFVPLGLWISALSSGVHVSMGALIGMKIRHIKPHRLVQPLIKANKAGLGLNISQLETHFLAGGNVDRVINALIAAQRANIPMAFEKACAIDLAGRDVFEAVQMSVTPKVIETPVVAAIAKDGIELRAKRHRPHEYRPSGRRRGRRNRYRACRRRHRDHCRLGGNPQAGAGES